MPASATEKTRELTCYYWYNYGKCRFDDEICGYAHTLLDKIAEQPVVREPGRPAVAGRNARQEQPVYRDWQTERTKRAIPPHLLAQIQAIHDKQLMTPPLPPQVIFSQVPIFAPVPVFFPALPAPPAPAVTSKPIAPLTSSPQPFIPASQQAQTPAPAPAPSPLTITTTTALLSPARPTTPDQEHPSANSSPASPPRVLQPPIARPTRTTPTSAAISELTQHLHYAHVEMVEQCTEALKALMIFEEGYVKREGFPVGGLTPAERFRSAMGRILDVCDGHLALLEAHKAV